MTPDSKGWYKASPIARLRDLFPPRRESHWSFNERLRTRPKKQSQVDAALAELDRLMKLVGK